MRLYNFASGRVEEIISLDSSMEAKNYLPQDSALHAQLEDYVKAGNSFVEALVFCIEDYHTAVYQELGDWYSEQAQKGGNND